MANGHLQAIRSGVRFNKELKSLTYSGIGTKAHPRGQMVAAYRRAVKALKGNLDNPAVVAAVMTVYRSEVLAAATDSVNEAFQIGVDHATRNAGALDLTLAGSFGIEAQAAISEAITSITALVDNQIRSITSGALTEAQILGGPSRVGLFSIGGLQKETANRLGSIAQAFYLSGLAGSLLQAGEITEAAAGVFVPAPGGKYSKQAVAAIDENTTPCCLGVHGQIREMDETFFTPNPPAYASQQEKPPFHDFCRTSQVLILRSTGADKLTRQMQEAAQLEKELRELPGYSAPHPANAFSRIRR